MATAFDKCITQALAAKALSQKRADELREQIERQINAGVSPTEAGQAARGLDALDSLEADALRRKANAIRQVRSDAWNTAEAAAHPMGPVFGAASKIVRDVTGMARWGNAESKAHFWQRHFQGRVTDAISQLRAKGIIGQTQDHALAESVALELRGKDTGSASAKALAKTFTETFEEARQLFNQAGGMIRSRADWGTPQWHDTGTVLRMGLDKWRTFIQPLLDPAKMVRPDGTPMTAADLPDVLEAAFRDITGTTVAKRGKGAAANRHMDHRVLVFKDADSWLAYNRKAGNSDIFGGFISHLDGMAKEIGHMQVLGPNPEAGVAAMQEMVAKQLGLRKLGPVKDWLASKGWNVNSPEAKVRRIQGMWETVRGNSVHPGSVVQMMQAVASLNVSTKLGGAAVSSMADEATIKTTAAWNGLSYVRVMREQLAQMTSEEHRLFAIRAGIGWDSWVRHGIATNRFADEAVGKGFAANAAEATMRASGLNVVTDARRGAFGMEFLGALGELSGKSLDEIRVDNPKTARALEAYGFDAADWEALRAHGTVDFDGARYVHPATFMDRIAAVNGKLPLLQVQRVADNLMRMVRTETDFAVPTPGALERYISTVGTQAGTFRGQLTRQVFQFKTFPITMATTHLARAFYQPTAGKKAAYVIPFFIATTGAGAVIMQARALMNGRTPLDMTRPEFWGAAAAQGGGASIAGDFAYQGLGGGNRFGGSPIDTLLGPTYGMAKDLTGLAFSSVQGDLSSKSLVEFGTRNLIPGSSLWYTRLIFERGVKDQLMLLGDEAAARRSFASRERFYRDQGSSFYWPQGELTPGGN